MVAGTYTNGFETLFSHGSRTVRVDFHLHTKADKEFNYEDDDNKFCQDYVQRLVEEGISAGVITNHNKFDFEEFKALRKTARKRGILLLPGVELSVNDGSNGVHTLIVFSNEWLERGVDCISPFINATFGGEPPQNFQNQNKRTKYSLVDTINFLEERNDDFFLVFAHVRQRNGLWKELRGGRIQELGEAGSFKRRTLGFQKVNENEGKETPRKQDVKDWLDGWYPAEVDGSDCKSIDQIGKGPPCYLQLGELSFEAVKYALADHSNRVYRGHRTAGHSHILSATFEGGVLDGKTVNFSPHLNTLIGMRGSGKSSILESVRYALDVPFGVKAWDRDYKEDLVGHVLGSGGTITLTIVDAKGQTFSIRRIYGQDPTVYVDGAEQPNVSVQETIVRNPIYFGQKDLSASGEGFEKDLVEKFIGKNLQGIRARAKSQREKVQKTIERLNKLSHTDETRKHLELKRGDAQLRLKFYEKHGIEDKLQKQVSFDEDERKCMRLEFITENYSEQIVSLLNKYEGYFEQELSYDSKHNRGFFNEVFELFKGNIQSVQELKKLHFSVKGLLERLQNKTKELQASKNSLKEEFAEINRKMAEELQGAGVDKVSSDEYLKLRNTIAETNEQLEDLKREEVQRGSLIDELYSELANLERVWQEEYKAIQDELEKVNDKHSSLKISVEYKADREAYLERLKGACQGSRIRGTTLASIVDKFSDFGEIYTKLDEVKAIVGGSADVFEEYFTEELSQLLTWQIPHKFTIEYQGRELRHHSLGQRASALIIFILSQKDNDLILIDQPEDDLDSRTIYEDVVKFVRLLKTQVQFIFATHEPNFPVLGDAEQVSSCAYSDDEISVTSGSIDSQELQREVVNVMEGGSEAFNQRKKIYELWNE